MPVRRPFREVLAALVVVIPFLIPAQASAADEGWEQVLTAAQQVAPSSGLLVAEVADGECTALHETGADQRLAIASTFKLYVLAELARQIEAGEADWDEELAIRDGLKSMPSGSMLYLPVGSTRPLRYYAERMIAESDNTATDHLIYRLGRRNVENALSAFGHDAPQANTPLLMTREFFAFKISVDPADIDDYLDAPDAEQRRFLEQNVAPIRLNEFYWGDWTAPRRIDSVEWFATPRELCRLLAKLDKMAEQPELAPIRDILALNRGGFPEPSVFPYAGFKSGYEAGVFDLTWLVACRDGRSFVVTATFNDPIHYVNQGAAWNVALAAATKLAEDARAADR